MPLVVTQPFFVANTGPLSFGLFIGGRTDINIIDKYNFNTDAVTPYTSLNTGRHMAGAHGNRDLAIVSGGFGSPENATTEKITYADDSIVASSALLEPGYARASFGNDTVGVVGTADQNSYNMQKYTYSTDTVTLHGNVIQRRENDAGFSSPTHGYACGGNYVVGGDLNYMEKYQYSTNSITYAGTLTQEVSAPAAASNSTLGLVGGGLNYTLNANVDRVNKFPYATGSSSIGTSLSAARNQFAACSNEDFAVFSNGRDKTLYVSNVDKYFYSDDTVSAGTSLSYGGYDKTAVSNVHGGLNPI